MKTFNFYCDESCHLENDKKSYMLISYVSVPYNQMDFLKETYQGIKKSFNVTSELKWSNIYQGKEEFYYHLVDFFFNTELKFRSVVIKKDQIKKEHYGEQFDDFYYRMYYQLLYHKLDMECNYNIYLDIKDTLGSKKVRKLKDILRINYSTIRNIQTINSKESIFMQIGDFLMGAINYKLNIPDEEKTGRVSKLKSKIISRIEKQSGLQLDKGTTKNQEKMNLFFIDLKK